MINIDVTNKRSSELAYLIQEDLRSLNYGTSGKKLLNKIKRELSLRSEIKERVMKTIEQNQKDFNDNVFHFEPTKTLIDLRPNFKNMSLDFIIKAENRSDENILKHYGTRFTLQIPKVALNNFK